jgi:hypothetical protein
MVKMATLDLLDLKDQRMVTLEQRVMKAQQVGRVFKEKQGNRDQRTEQLGQQGQLVQVIREGQVQQVQLAPLEETPSCITLM